MLVKDVIKYFTPPQISWFSYNVYSKNYEFDDGYRPYKKENVFFCFEENCIVKEFRSYEFEQLIIAMYEE